MDNDRYKELHDKVDDHTKSITVVSKAVEDINKNVERVADNYEKLGLEMMQHYYNQDKMMEKLIDHTEEIKEVKKVQQTTGCTPFTNFVHTRDIEIKRYEEIIERHATAHKKARNEIEELQKDLGITDEKVKVANKRIADLEQWKENVFKLLVGKGFALILILSGVIYDGMMSK